MSVGLQRLRDDAEAIRRGATDKGEDARLVDRALGLDAERRKVQATTDGLRATLKSKSAEVARALKDGSDTQRLRNDARDLGARIADQQARLETLEAQLEDLLLRIPNPADRDVPVGGEEANATVRTWGEPLPRDAGGWQRTAHWDLAERLDIIDNVRGAKVAGSGSPVYKGGGSALERGLIQWFMDTLTEEFGFTEVWPPVVVNEDSARGTGQIPDKEDQMYVVTRDGLYLVPTAEVPVTNLHRDEILDGSSLPIRYCAYTPCFRREAGAAGKETRGIVRVHQFD